MSVNWVSLIIYIREVYPDCGFHGGFLSPSVQMPDMGASTSHKPVGHHVLLLYLFTSISDCTASNGIMTDELETTRVGTLIMATLL
jgi:hypothetical protein